MQVIVTVTVDERVGELARKAAQSIGKTLDQALHDYVLQLAECQLLQADLTRFEHSAMNSPGQLREWKFNREDANHRANAGGEPHTSVCRRAD
jgi:hypothetical protein